jgi:NAD(P)H-nitrite reductase large subunit
LTSARRFSNEFRSFAGRNTGMHAAWLKYRNFQDDALVCYCFNYTKKQIENDYAKHGRSTILEKIASEKKAGGCDCAVKNPKKR